MALRGAAQSSFVILIITIQIAMANYTHCPKREAMASTSSALDDQLRYLWYEVVAGAERAFKSVIQGRRKKNVENWSFLVAIFFGANTLAYASVRSRLIFRIRKKKDQILSTMLQNYNLQYVNDAAYARTIGIPFYSYSFMTGTLSELKSLELGCSVADAKNELYFFPVLRHLDKLERKISNFNHLVHPLLQLGPELLPDVLLHQLDLMKLR